MNGAVDLALAVFDVPTGGTARSLWTAPATPFEDGLAVLAFGTGSDTLASRALWIEVHIVDPGSGVSVVLSPRIALTAVPLAVVAQRAVALSVDTIAIDADQIQRRAAASCTGVRPRLAAIDHTGNAPNCAADRGIDGIAPGLGLGVSGAIVAVQFAQAQARRTPHCDPGFAMRQLPVVSPPVCVPDATPLRGLIQVEASCNFAGFGGSETGCAATARCPAQAPAVIGGGQVANCSGVSANASFPVNDTLGRGWTSSAVKRADVDCGGSVTLRSFAYCTAGP